MGGRPFLSGPHFRRPDAHARHPALDLDQVLLQIALLLQPATRLAILTHTKPPNWGISPHPSYLRFPAKGRRLALIGFVFLCPCGLVYCHNLLSNKPLRRYPRRQIGFVFSNSPSGETPAGWQPQSRRLWGWLGPKAGKLALNWLCFFAAFNA